MLNDEQNNIQSVMVLLSWLSHKCFANTPHNIMLVCHTNTYCSLFTKLSIFSELPKINETGFGLRL